MVGMWLCHIPTLLHYDIFPPCGNMTGGNMLVSLSCHHVNLCQLLPIFLRKDLANFCRLFLTFCRLLQTFARFIERFPSFANFCNVLANFSQLLPILQAFSNFWQCLLTYGNLGQLMPTETENVCQLLPTLANFWQLLTTIANFCQLLEW